jgi:hypothetical protein
MDTVTLVKVIGDGMGLIVIPWTIWVTVSLFNQRQELAILRKILEHITAPPKIARE